jgi:dihydroorotate dehydrogenase (NAD+) catalytic subunit
LSRLAVTLNRLHLANPILVASGTFGYAREMQSFVRLARIGGIIPKTVTPLPRIGNPPPRTVETSGGMLNSIGLDNDGLETFIQKHLGFLLEVGTSVVVNIAGRDIGEFVAMATRLDEFFPRIAALELNISCPNVSGGVDFGTDPKMTAELVGRVREACRLPVIAKLTPNVTSIVAIAEAAAAAGADAVSLVNTFQGLVVNWRQRRPVLGGGFGGLSGPAIKPLALRAVCQVARAVRIPVIGVGGIASIDDVMDYLVCGASAIQVGTANFYDPGIAERLVDQLDQLMVAEGWQDLRQVIGTLQPAQKPAQPH